MIKNKMKNCFPPKLGVKQVSPEISYVIWFYIIKNVCACWCQRHKDSQEQRLKERSKLNFQTRNKIRLCDSNK